MEAPDLDGHVAVLRGAAGTARVVANHVRRDLGQGDVAVLMALCDEMDRLADKYDTIRRKGELSSLGGLLAIDAHFTATLSTFRTALTSMLPNGPRDEVAALGAMLASTSL